jgi:hypothetical protein
MFGRGPINFVMLRQPHQAFGFTPITDHHPIITFRRLKGDVAVNHVVEHPLRVALERIAIPPTTGQVEVNVRIRLKPNDRFRW